MAAFMSVRLIGGQRISANIRNLMRRFPRLAAQSMRTSATATLVPAMRKRLKQNKSVFTGELHSRLGVRSSAGTSMTDAWIEVGSLGVPYGLNVEKGSPPHTPDSARIHEYVRKKMGKSGDEADNLAYAIETTIRSQGTRPHPYIAPVWSTNRSAFYADTVRRMKANLALPRS
jgi:hypothetical protein